MNGFLIFFVVSNCYWKICLFHRVLFLSHNGSDICSTCGRVSNFSCERVSIVDHRYDDYSNRKRKSSKCLVTGPGPLSRGGALGPEGRPQPPSRRHQVDSVPPRIRISQALLCTPCSSVSLLGLSSDFRRYESGFLAVLMCGMQI